MEANQNSKSLYERLGGHKGIEAIVDDIVELHMSNPAVKARFLPLKDDPQHFAEVRQHLINFLAAGSGGPEEYAGKDMTTAHKGMNISQGEYMNAVDDIMKALDKHNIDEQTKKDVLFIAYSLKGSMVHV
ncbi:group 1 truncated hemoglobin [Flavobacterium sufflavum]|uniref:Group 1 truncated hemoglobin n=1 Tax=Flavobacterium sufflavum TaxID=1921138 RepID=A0A437L436_9FLAO|nr:group 1 truncated hemoglobin [Flavobacterium sufflavum]RVT80055.1 group 1 truncated hemoglobin [Flavobacterium sufflavum]